MKQLDQNHFQLSTGRTFYAHGGIIGVDDSMGVSHGWDGSVDVWPREWMKDVAEDWSGWTKEERRELAEYMIALWQKFADAACAD